MPPAADDLLLERFHRIAAGRSGEVWLVQPTGDGAVDEITFGRALDEARRMAAHLGGLGFPPGSRIAIASKNCAHFILADLAIWLAGHVSVPLFPTLRAGMVAELLEHSGSRLLFVGKLDPGHEIERGAPADLPRVALPLAPPGPHPRWDDLVAQQAPDAPSPVRRPEDWATLIYTSGSTGRPKAAIHTFGSLSAAAYGGARLLDVGPRDRGLSYLPLAHGMDRWISECTSLATGYRLYFAERLETFAEDLRRARPTLFLSVPRLWWKLQRGVLARMPQRRLDLLLRVPVASRLVRRRILRELGLDQVRFAGSGSAPIPPGLLAWFRALGLELLEGYGMSENLGYSHVTRPGDVRPGTVGHPYEGVECRLGEDGEILVRSPAAMAGYYRDPALTAETRTEDGFFRTGDLGTLDGGGRLTITGRVKDLFKTSKGKYVAPVPIENLLAREPCIEQSCVAGSGQVAPHGVVQLAEELHARFREPALRAEVGAALEARLAALDRELSGHERLAFLAVAKDRWTIEDGSLTPSLKLRRAVLEARYAPELERWYASGRRVIWQD